MRVCACAQDTGSTDPCTDAPALLVCHAHAAAGGPWLLLPCALAWLLVCWQGHKHVSGEALNGGGGQASVATTTKAVGIETGHSMLWYLQPGSKRAELAQIQNIRHFKYPFKGIWPKSITLIIYYPYSPTEIVWGLCAQEEQPV